MKTVADLKVRIFADGAELAGMLEMYARPYIKGFTTNPTLMHNAGLTDYRTFARSILKAIADRPISFEVFSDEFEEMERQAREIATWGNNVYVKIPVTNTRREPAYSLVHRLSHEGVKLNVTALMTPDQVRAVVGVIKGGAPCCISVFAGRIADTGRDPIPIMQESLKILEDEPAAELIWASPRELLNIFQADAIGCHIITVTNDVLKKLPLVGKDLTEFSLDTVKMFYDDGRKAGFSLLRCCYRSHCPRAAVAKSATNSDPVDITHADALPLLPPRPGCRITPLPFKISTRTGVIHAARS